MSAPAPGSAAARPKLEKDLGLFDVYAISTGAMFSSGFFLLPGLAAAQTGPSVALAYLVSALFILPAMLSVAELCTAMPKAGGAYYFLDRAMGPLMGTVGGLGTWVALILKSAFALVGLGAYLALYVDVPIEPLAVALTVVFVGVNIVGAKKSGGLQQVLVVVLLAVLALFVVQGLVEISSQGIVEVTRERFDPFFVFGATGFLSTVGFVFVSYAGLTGVASVAEEVRDPDRNIPLGMILSLITAAVIYTVGVYILVAVLPPEQLRADLTPVASAAATFSDWLPGGAGLILIVVAAIAAFASTGNAGILSASRFPLAMARDRLVSARFGTLGRFRTPTFSIVATGGLIAAAILLLDVASIAKLASAFQLLLFALLNLAVIIMRESGIEGYDPGFRSPLYPWMQIGGGLASLGLIAEMGELAIAFTLGLVALTLVWYFTYVQRRVERAGAVFHVVARLGARRQEEVDLELRSFLREQGLREKDPYDEVVAQAPVMEIPEALPLEELIGRAAASLEQRTGIEAAELESRLRAEAAVGLLPVARGAALPHARMPGLRRPVLLLMRCPAGVLPAVESEPAMGDLSEVRAVFFLVTPEDRPGQHLRLLGHLASHVDDPDFLERWMAARDEAELRATLLQEDRALILRVGESPGTVSWAGKTIEELDLPRETLVALVRRDGEAIIPGGSTVLLRGDRLTIIGEPEAIRELTETTRRSSAGQVSKTPMA